jgi:hypothetical protein
MLLSKVSVTVADAVAALLKNAVQSCAVVDANDVIDPRNPLPVPPIDAAGILNVSWATKSAPPLVIVTDVTIPPLTTTVAAEPELIPYSSTKATLVYVPLVYPEPTVLIDTVPTGPYEKSCDAVMVVLAGIPLPVTVTPAPTAAMVVANLINVEPVTVVAEAVNTPTSVSVVFGHGPTNGLVSTVDEMSLRF